MGKLIQFKSQWEEFNDYLYFGFVLCPEVLL